MPETPFLIKILTKINLDTRSLYNYILWLKISSMKIILYKPNFWCDGYRVANS